MQRGPVATAAMAGPSLGPSRAAEYQRLLQEITVLQSDLQNTIQALQATKAEVTTLRDENDLLKDDQRKLRKKTEDLRKQWRVEAQEKLDLQRKYEELTRQWNDEIEKKAEEFEELTTKLAPPRDLDMLRIKIQEELEVPHAERMAAMQAEVDKYREMFFNVRREHELLKTEFEQFTVDQAKEAEATHDAHNHRISVLQTQLVELRHKLDEREASTALRDVEIENEDLRSRLARVLAECADLRRDKDHAVAARDTNSLAFSRQQAEMTAAIGTLQLDKAALERQLQSHDVELQRATHSLADAVHERDKLRAEVSRLTDALRIRDRELTDVTNQHEAREATNEANWDREKMQLESKVAQAQQALQTAQAEAAQSKSALAEADRHAMTAASHERAAIVQRASHLQQQLERAHVEVREMEIQVTNNRAECKRQLASMAEQISSMEERVRQAEADRGVAEMRVKELQDQLDGTSSEGKTRASSLHDLEEEYRRLQATHREVLAKQEALVTVKAQLEATVQSVEQDLQELQTEHARLAETSQLALRQQRDHASRTEAELTQKLKSLREDSIRVVAKSKKRADGYKAQLIELYKKYKRLQASSAQSDAEKDAAAKRLQEQLKAATRRLTDLEQQREMWGSVPLTTGAAGGGSSGSAMLQAAVAGLPQ